jgi:hypothetical protein
MPEWIYVVGGVVIAFVALIFAIHRSMSKIEIPIGQYDEYGRDFCYHIRPGGGPDPLHPLSDQGEDKGRDPEGNTVTSLPPGN